MLRSTQILLQCLDLKTLAIQHWPKSEKNVESFYVCRIINNLTSRFKTLFQSGVKKYWRPNVAPGRVTAFHKNPVRRKKGTVAETLATWSNQKSFYYLWIVFSLPFQWFWLISIMLNRRQPTRPSYLKTKPIYSLPDLINWSNIQSFWIQKFYLTSYLHSIYSVELMDSSLQIVKADSLQKVKGFVNVDPNVAMLSLNMKL